MKILLTGGCGFIGGHLVRLLLHEESVRIVNVDKLTYAGCSASLDDVAEDSRYVLQLVDLAGRDSVEAVFASHRPDAVVHLAAESHVDRSIDGPDDFVRTNLLGTFNLLEAARRHFDSLALEKRDRFRFVHVSTDEVYGSLGAVGKFDERSAYDPRSPYAATKAGADHLARAWFHTYGLPVIVTNGCNNYGPYQFPEKLIPLVILKAIQGQAIPVYGDGSQVRDWLHVHDHVEALRMVVERGRPGETYNVGADNERRNLELVEMICDVLDDVRPRTDGKSHRDQIELVEDRPGHDQRYAIDATKIRDELGWKPKVDFPTGLRDTVLWYLDNEDWWRPIVDGTYQLGRLGRLERSGRGQS